MPYHTALYEPDYAGQRCTTPHYDRTIRVSHLFLGVVRRHQSFAERGPPPLEHQISVDPLGGERQPLEALEGLGND